MPKLDIKLADFHGKIKELRKAAIAELNKTHDVLAENYNHFHEHPMFRAEVLLSEFKGLSKLNYRYSQIQGSKAKISSMFSKEGNKLVSEAVQKFIRTCPEDAKTAVDILTKECKEIEVDHPEINDTAVREQIYWYTEPFIEIYQLQEKS
jgi:hypothetical protein